MMVGPKLRMIPNNDMFELAEDWEFRGFTLKEGFRTNIDSIPPIPIIHGFFKGEARQSAILHDYLYDGRLVDRKTADKIFYRSMIEDDGVPRYKAAIMYGVVRIFGSSFFRN